jgi:drug/metabolite transporter (DMT)-like permease
MSGNEVWGLGALAIACLFAAAILLRSWRRRGTRQPLVAAIVVLVLGAGAVTLALFGAPYRIVVGSAFVLAMLAILVTARSERGRS